MTAAQDLNADNHQIVSNLKKGLDELTNKHNELQTQVNQLTQAKDQLNTKVDQLTQDKNDLSTEVNNLKNKNAELERKIEDYKIPTFNTLSEYQTWANDHPNRLAYVLDDTR